MTTTYTDQPVFSEKELELFYLLVRQCEGTTAWTAMDKLSQLKCIAKASHKDVCIKAKDVCGELVLSVGKKQ